MFRYLFGNFIDLDDYSDSDSDSGNIMENKSEELYDESFFEIHNEFLSLIKNKNMPLSFYSTGDAQLPSIPGMVIEDYENIHFPLKEKEVNKLTKHLKIPQISESKKM